MHPWAGSIGRAAQASSEGESNRPPATKGPSPTQGHILQGPMAERCPEVHTNAHFNTTTHELIMERTKVLVEADPEQACRGRRFRHVLQGKQATEGAVRSSRPIPRPHTRSKLEEKRTLVCQWRGAATGAPHATGQVRVTGSEKYHDATPYSRERPRRLPMFLKKEKSRLFVPSRFCASRFHPVFMHN